MPVDGKSADEPWEQQKPWDKVLDFKTVRYTGLRASASYPEWRDWKQWLEDNDLAKTLKSK